VLANVAALLSALVSALAAVVGLVSFLTFLYYFMTCPDALERVRMDATTTTTERERWADV
jgi:hypothetical protein